MNKCKMVIVVFFILFDITFLIMLSHNKKVECGNPTEKQKEDEKLNLYAKEYFGENSIRVSDYDIEDKNVYKIFGLDGEQSPIYIWMKALVTDTETNMPSQQVKRDAVEFWCTRARTIYYVNGATGKEELLNDSINSVERVFEDDWHLKIECKSRKDCTVLATELAEWTQYVLRESPYRRNYAIGYYERNITDLLKIKGTDGTDDTVFISLKIMYDASKIEGKQETFEEIIERELIASFGY